MGIFGFFWWNCVVLLVFFLFKEFGVGSFGVEKFELKFGMLKRRNRRNGVGFVW